MYNKLIKPLLMITNSLLVEGSKFDLQAAVLTADLLVNLRTFFNYI